MDETTKEIAKATQEVAKATQEGIHATEKLGAFAAGLVREPVDSIVGILTDRLKFVRWKRQIRLLDEAERLIRDRRLQGRLLPVPPKLALPIMEYATLEEDDSLQDLWIRLLIEAADPGTQKRVRVAFIDVIKQLEPTDAKLLNFAYQRGNEKLVDFTAKYQGTHLTISSFGINQREIMKALTISDSVYKISVDSLMRQRCITSSLEEDDIEVGDSGPQTFTHDRGYDEICITPFGASFVEVCIC